MYKLIAPIIMVASLSACSDAPPEQNVVLKSPESSVQQNGQQTNSPVQDQFLELGIDTTSKFPEVQTLMDETVAEYKGIVAEIRKTFEEERKKVSAEVDANIAEIKAAYEEQNAEYQKQCSEVNANNESSCNRFGEQTHNLKMKYESLEVEKKNILAKITSDEVNKLKMYQAKAKNNIMALKEQSGEL